MNIQPDYAPVTPQEFFAWVPGQEGRYELVDGEVVMMAGAGRRHDAIVVNLIASIRPQTRGGPCQTFTGDTYVATTKSNRRMPDMGIDCGKPDDNSLLAEKPSLVVEVLSPTTGGFDVTIKLTEYQAVPSLDYILFVDTENPTVHIYRRDSKGLWQDEVIKGLDEVVELTKLKVSLSLRDIYEGLEFRPKPKLVQTSDDEPERGGGFKPPT
ncbi:MAG TPA: Uma2 family endonuclease [Gemmataceae bacterium]|jgi:Uma2 family endonuclease|nr:Uma2 family endonuclease [Gemmataceae bacterium]